LEKIIFDEKIRRLHIIGSPGIVTDDLTIGETYVQSACKGEKGEKGKRGRLIKANTPITLEVHKVPVPTKLESINQFVFT